MPDLTTELNAVNTILGVAGQSPVNSLDDSNSVDVATARNILDETSRDVQTQGWHFNTEFGVELTRDSDDEINLAANILQIDVEPNCHWDIDPIQRGNRLYDVKNRAYKFKKNLKAEVVYFLSFTEIPQAARHYIAIKAARLFQDRQVGSKTKHDFTEQDEARAKARLMNANMRSGDYNIFRGDPNLARTVRANR